MTDQNQTKVANGILQMTEELQNEMDSFINKMNEHAGKESKVSYQVWVNIFFLTKISQIKFELQNLKG